MSYARAADLLLIAHKRECLGHSSVRNVFRGAITGLLKNLSIYYGGAMVDSGNIETTFMLETIYDVRPCWNVK